MGPSVNQGDDGGKLKSVDLPMYFLVGTFTQCQPYIFTLRFNPSSNRVDVTNISNAIGAHSWLSFSPDQQTLYATAWNEPSCSIAAYRHMGPSAKLELLGSKPVRNKPGYVTCSNSHIYSVGGQTGEVFRIEDNGTIGDLVQELDFTVADERTVSASPASVPHGDFGGLRHGAHGCDLSHDGKTLFVADIGRNCTWSFAVDKTKHPILHDRQRHAAPREDDGPRHTWPHPNGQLLYVVQEHSSMIDVFRLQKDEHGLVKSLDHVQGASILPEGKDAADYWADEVRLSTGPDKARPQYLFASTRGLEPQTKGYVSVFELNHDGTLKQTVALDIWETPTSGGIANAIEPAPWPETVPGDISPLHFLAMTDSEACKVFILSFDGTCIQMVDSCTLEVPTKERDAGVEMVQPATAVWMKPVLE